MHSSVVAASCRFVPERLERPWGEELVWAAAERYSGRLLLIRRDGSLEERRAEGDTTLHVQQGSLEVELVHGDTGRISSGVLEAGQSIRLEPGQLHRLRAQSDVSLLEVSAPPA